MPVLPGLFLFDDARENFGRSKTSSIAPPQNFGLDGGAYTAEQVEAFLLSRSLPAGVARVLSSLAMIESGGNPAAIGLAGEQGLFQVLPSAWQSLVRGSAPAGLSLADQWDWAAPVVADVGRDVSAFANAHGLNSANAARVFNLSWQFGAGRVGAWLQTAPPSISAQAFTTWLKLPANVALDVLRREGRFLALVARTASAVSIGALVVTIGAGLGLVLLLRKILSD